MKPYVYKESESGFDRTMAFLLKNEPTSVLYVALVKPHGVKPE